MKLLTHNFLSSKCIRGVKLGYPLKIEASKVDVRELEFNEDALQNILPKLDWAALVAAAEALGHGSDLPKDLPSEDERGPEFWKSLHRAAFEVIVQEGYLECPETGRKFPIKNGIPNMLVNEDEV